MVRTIRFVSASIVVAALFAALGVHGPVFAGDDPPAAKATVSKEEAKEALEAFEKEYDEKVLPTRLAAIRKLADVPHPDVADALLKKLKRSRAPEVTGALFDALAGQPQSAEDVGPVVVRLVEKEAERKTELLKKGQPEFLLDNRTGDPDTASPAGKKALADLAVRDQMIAAGMRCLLALDYHERLEADAIPPLLQSAEDDLVVAALEAVARFEMWTALPEVLFLFKMYPRDNRWETGAAHDLTGTGSTATAKRAWMLFFGHPGKQIPRPRVVEALKKSVEDLTGVEVEDPADLKALLRRKDVKEKVEGGKRRH